MLGALVREPHARGNEGRTNQASSRSANLFFDSSANHPGLVLPFCKPQGETHLGHPNKQMLHGVRLAS